MGLVRASFSPQENLAARKKQDCEKTRRDRLEVVGSYLELIDRLKTASRGKRSDLQILERLYRLVEMSSLNKLRAAEHVADWHLTRRAKVLDEMKRKDNATSLHRKKPTL